MSVTLPLVKSLIPETVDLASFEDKKGPFSLMVSVFH